MNKKLAWILVGVAGVAVLVMWGNPDKEVPSPLSFLNGDETSPSPTPSATPKKVATPKPAAQSAATSSNTTDYTRLATDFIKVGGLIQFNDRCQPTPGQLTIKAGSQVMLDNRSTVAKTIKLDTVSYSLPAFTYRIITPTTNRSLPYNLTLDCQSSNGSTENGAIIKLQALIRQ